MDDDLRLIEEFGRGSESAIEELIVKYQKLIYAFTYRMVGEAEEARDLTQKTFMNAVSGLGSFRADASFKTWLYRIAGNVCLNHIRQRKKEDELDEGLASGGPGVLAELVRKERIAAVRKGLERLPERQRLAVVLRVYEGLSCEDSAQVMGCSPVTVKTNYHFGIKRLREVLKEEGHETKP